MTQWLCDLFAETKGKVVFVWFGSLGSDGLMTLIITEVVPL